ncbi:MAG TPA: hypothetical protein VER76_06690, partial [Pyrinomonadaceae bacterium]|nr:hypothetical protein [Pyrinomonadaceae bacterium]
DVSFIHALRVNFFDITQTNHVSPYARRALKSSLKMAAGIWKRMSTPFGSVSEDQSKPMEAACQPGCR